VLIENSISGMAHFPLSCFISEPLFVD